MTAFGAALLGLLVLSASAFAAGGSISGHVENVAGEPLQNIQVTASGENGSFSYGYTNAEGDYALSELPDDAYHVSFEQSSGDLYAWQYYDGVRNYEDATLVTISGSGAQSGIDAVMQENGEIEGTVTKAAGGSTLEGIEVCAYADGAEWESACGETGADGKYVISGLAAGSYKVRFALNGEDNFQSQYYRDKATSDAAEPVTVVAGQPTTGIDAALHEGAKIEGTVTKAVGGEAMENVQVCVYEAEGPHSYESHCATTDGSGKYSIGGLVATGYVAWFIPGGNFVSGYYGGRERSEAQVIPVGEEATVTGIDAEIQLGGEIEGKVTTVGGAPLESVSVCTVSGFHCDYTNADGEYTIVGIAPGAYKVEFYGSGNYLTQYFDGKESSAEAEAVTVSEGQTRANVDAQMKEGGEIVGTVTAAAGGAAIADSQVCARSTEPGHEYESHCTYTDSTGHYVIPGLRPGHYKVEFSPPYGGHYVAQYYNQKERASEAFEVPVAAEQITGTIDGHLHEGGRLAGQVTAAAGGTGLAGVEVCATIAEFGQFCGETDSSGDYEIDGLPTGKYRVFFDTLPSGRNYVSEYYDHKASAAEANRVQVTEEQLTDGINAALEAGAQIKGKVHAAGGSALRGIEVCAYDNSESPREGETHCATTDEEGVYAITGLAGSEYLVEFEGNGSYLTRYYDEKESAATADTVSVAPGATAANVNAEMQEGGRISGKVTGEGGASLGEVEVCAEPTSGGYEYTNFCGESTSNGEYEITGLPSGSYRVSFYPGYEGEYLFQYYSGVTSSSEAEPVSVTAGETHPDVNAQLVRAAKIQGKVTAANGGAAIGNITVCAYPDEGENEPGGWCGFTNLAGEYTLHGVPAGTYDIRFSAGFGAEEKYLTQYYDGQPSAAQAEPVTVVAGASLTGIDAQLLEGGEITGKVTDAGGHPLSGISVCASLRSEDEYFYRCAGTGADGTYKIVGVESGKYTLSFYGSSYVEQYYDGKARNSEADAVEVTIGHPTPNIDVTMQAGGAVEGVVATEDGEGVEDAQVCAQQGTGEDLSNCSFTGTAGRYKIQGLSAGSYTIEFMPGYSGGNFLSQYYDGKASADEADPVAVTAGSTQTGIDATLQAGAEIRGTVTAAADGSRLDDIEVCAYSGDDVQPTACGSTGEFGRYAIRGLAAGAYEVRFSSWETCSPGGCATGSYAPQFYSGKASRAEAQPVSVGAGEVLRGIGATMESGGSISGTVTDASTHDPVQGTEVCAYRVGETESETCGSTESDGTYDLQSLSGGPHVVSFEGGSLCGAGGCSEPEYATQYFDGEPSAAKADPVSVTVGEETSGIDAAMAEPSEPVPANTSLPEITGTAAVGQTLTCSQGSWSNGPTDYEYAWLRGGATIGSADASTYVVQEADGGSNLSCRVTASNGGGSASATSAAVSILAKPSFSALPQVTGTLVVGGQLTCQPGTWSGGPSFAYAWLRDGSAIGGAVHASYAVAQGDVGHELACRVTATNASGSAEATSAAVRVPAKPVDTTPPSVEGTAAVGQTLTCNPGAWEHGPTFAYVWLRGAAPITGAEASTYEVQTADQGQNLACEVTATNGDGSATATSPPFPIPAAAGAPTNTSPPEITGTAAVGQTLTCSQGTWTNDPTDYEYAWLRGTTPISGVAVATYVVQEVDAGAGLSCVVTAKNATGPKSATSAPVDVPAKPVDTSPPEITGTAAVGQTLTCAKGSWSNGPTDYEYAWLRGAAPISGAEASTYEVQGADGGHELKCKVTASNGGGSASATSDPVSVPVPPQAPVDTALPQISGSPALGQTLTCSQGSWSNDPTGYGYAWLRGGAPIGGATGSTYGVQDADQGQSLACRVTASNAGGSTDATSPAVQVPAASSGGGGGDVPSGGGGGGGSGETSSSSTSSGTAPVGQPSPPPSGTPATSTPPRHRVGACKKGFVKKKVHHKARCVKKPKHKKVKKHPKRK
jgi:hypothetical protein